MGQKQSRDRLLYQYVVDGDIEGIHFLSKQGASLEWKDKKGKTPLIVAAKDPRLYVVAKTLVELGANVNAVSRGRGGGAPLHYAAKEGLDRTVILLLSHGGCFSAVCIAYSHSLPVSKHLHNGAVNTAPSMAKSQPYRGLPLRLRGSANAFVKNEQHQTPLDVARKNARNIVVREIESRICSFAGYIREIYGPGFSDASAPQLSSRVVWVVVVPRGPQNPQKRPKLELVIYSTPQDAEPRKIVSPKRYKIKEPKFNQPSPALIIIDKFTETHYKFSSVSAGDKQQLRRLYNACKGISQVMPVSDHTRVEGLASPLRTMTENARAMEANTSFQSSPIASGRSSSGYVSPLSPINPSRMPSSDVWFIDSPVREYSGWPVTESWTPPNRSPLIGRQANHLSPVVHKPDRFPAATSPLPSAPPISSDERFSLDDISIPANQNESSTVMPVAAKDKPDSSSCVICWEAPVEGACVPCGHVSSCMACLKKIEDEKGVCPVCRSHIDQVVKLYGI